MRRVLVTVVLLVLASCSAGFVSDNKFNIDEDGFKEAYEKVSDRNMPTNISASPYMVKVNYATKEEAIDFLNTFHELTNYKEVERLTRSVEADEGNIPSVINNEDITIIYVDKFDEYNISIHPDGEMLEGD